MAKSEEKKLCAKCGSKLKKDDKFCSACGEQVDKVKKESSIDIDELAKKATKTVEKVLDTEDCTKNYAKKDIEDNKAMAILAYFGPLALLPYFGQKNSKFTQFHAINGMNLFIWEIAYWFLHSVIESFCTALKFRGSADNISDILSRFYSSTIPWFLSIPLALISFILVALSVVGIVYASCGKAKELPIIGKIKLIKE